MPAASKASSLFGDDDDVSFANPAVSKVASKPTATQPPLAGACVNHMEDSDSTRLIFLVKTKDSKGNENSLFVNGIGCVVCYPHISYSFAV